MTAQQVEEQRRRLEAAVRQHGMLPSVVAMSAHEQRQYSVANAIRHLAEGSTETTLEVELSNAIARDLRQATQFGGIYIPWKLSMATGLDTKSNSAGGYLAQTKVSGDIIDALRSQSRLVQLGAKLVSGLKYETLFPRESNVSTAQWLPENYAVDASESDSSFGGVLTRPHSMQSTTSFSRQLLAQNSPDLEAWVRNRLAKAHAQLLDSSAISGTGTEGAPVGLLKTAGIGDVALGQNGLAPTLAGILSLEQTVSKAGADNPANSFLTTPEMRTKLRGVADITGGRPLWLDNTMLGYRAEVSGHVPTTLVKGSSSDCHAIVYGDFSALMLCEFGGAMEIVVDSYALKKQGMVEISSWDCYDVALTQAASVAAIQDARNV